MKLNHIDNAHEFDWGKTSHDYAAYRPGYPESFYDTLSALGIGTPGQRILDLGTGTGVLARAFAKRGAMVTGVDIAPNQIAAAQALARDEGVDVTFQVSASEAINFPEASFDVVSAAQSWLCFDTDIMVPKVLRLLKPDGCLVLTHLLWLPLKDPIARRTEELVLQFNPNWSAGGYSGVMPATFEWAQDRFDLRTFHVMEAPLPFTRESWRGRIRACRGIGASLSPTEIERFDAAHEELLASTVPEPFTVLHQMTIHAFTSKRAHTPSAQ